MGGDGDCADVVPGGESVVGTGARLLSSLGDVFRDVRGYGIVVRAEAVGAQRAGIDLDTPAEIEFADGGTVGSAHQDPPGGGAHGIGEPVCAAPGRGFVVRSGRAVEAYDRVYVDGRPLLVLRNTGDGQPGVRREERLCEANCRGELTPDADGEAVPELAHMRVPEDVGRVVVTVCAERLADDGIARVMDGAAAEGPTVLALSAVATRVADLAGAMHEPE
ncbi:hypothetical protein GCM10011579_084700 [Streptomyces albiflavescens]|uniref:Uncharacterized protein n=1 Tax=Streptomyces albiflavescens TaxID=1623582 RepID=A0A917YDS7_9ACTN|nr:hypothetical protein GCM10011579_084700 [Streptomyces albiflavescens]